MCTVQLFTILAKKKLLKLKNQENPPEKLLKLLKHERHKRVKFRRTGCYKSFVLDQHIPLEGLTKRLHGVFWTSGTAPKVYEGERAPSTAAGGASSCYYQGRSWKHGRKVHEDFARIVKNVTHQQTQKRDGSNMIAKVDPCSYRMFVRLVKNDIIPIICEMIIFDEYSRMGTAIDCIAYDVKKGRVVVIEIKTGHETQRNYSANNGKKLLKSSLSAIMDSPLNRASVQLVTSILILLRRYNVHVDDALILRPLSIGSIVQMYKMPRWILTEHYQRCMYADIRRALGTSHERREFNTPGTKRKRTAMQDQSAKQSYFEKRFDPKRNLFWIPTEHVEIVPECTLSDVSNHSDKVELPNIAELSSEEEKEEESSDSIDLSDHSESESEEEEEEKIKQTPKSLEWKSVKEDLVKYIDYENEQ